MAHKHLATYLNDHLAGSAAVLELLEHVTKAYAETDISGFAAGLHAEIDADRQTLEDVMKQLEITQSGPRKASGWIAHKLAQLKLRMDDPAAGDLRLHESMEAVSLGIEGKRLLWIALRTLAEKDPAFRGPDYADLERRAEDQRARVETKRLDAAEGALAIRP